MKQQCFYLETNWSISKSGILMMKMKSKKQKSVYYQTYSVLLPCVIPILLLTLSFSPYSCLILLPPCHHRRALQHLILPEMQGMTSYQISSTSLIILLILWYKFYMFHIVTSCNHVFFSSSLPSSWSVVYLWFVIWVHHVLVKVTPFKD